MSSSRIGHLLVRTGDITEEQLYQAESAQHESGGMITSALVNLGYIDELELLKKVSEHYALPVVELEESDIDTTILSMVPYELATKHRLASPRSKRQHPNHRNG